MSQQEMTPEQCAEAKKRCDAALVGPWRAFWQHEDKHFVVIQEDGSFLAEFGSWAEWVPDEANAEFAAHARADLPLALATIESLRQGNDNLRVELAETHSYMTYYRNDNDALKARLAQMRDLLKQVTQMSYMTGPPQLPWSVILTMTAEDEWSFLCFQAEELLADPKGDSDGKAG